MVSPWELEVDPDEERRRHAEAHRQQQAAARAKRARASSRRWVGVVRAWHVAFIVTGCHCVAWNEWNGIT